MNTTTVLGDHLAPQPKSKIKAGNGLNAGQYRFFTSSPIQSKFLNEYQYDDEALIFGTGGNASVHFCDEPFSSSTDCLVMYRKGDVNIKLIYYYLQGNMHLLQNGFKGAGLKHISKGYILDIPICMPSRDVQDEVVETLDMISKTENILNNQLKKLDGIVKARFLEMFGDPVDNEKGWDTSPLEEACVSIVDCPHSTPSYTDEDTGFMCIRTSIVKKNHILWDEIEYIPEEEFIQRIKRRKPQKGDVVYTREGAILGIAAIIDRDCNVALGQRSMLLTPDTTACLPEFLSVAMNFDSFLHKVTQGVSGSASPHINVGDIRVYNIMLPPIDLQQTFAAFYNDIEKSKVAVTQCLEKAKYLKSDLIQQYFG